MKTVRAVGSVGLGAGLIYAAARSRLVGSFAQSGYLLRKPATAESDLDTGTNSYIADRWTPAMRLLAAATGGALLALSLKRRDPLAMLAAIAGTSFVSSLGTASHSRDITVRKTLYIHAPVEEVFAFWTDCRNFPRVLRHIHEVRELGAGGWRWVGEGPAGTRLAWEAYVTRYQPPRLLEWISAAGSILRAHGEVRCEGGWRGGPTRLEVKLSYSSRGGTSVNATRREIEEDLARIKPLLEAAGSNLV